MGRGKFKEVFDTVVKMAKRRTWFRALMVYGTIGYGKSHIVAALALALMKKKKRIIYLPDCEELKVAFLKYLKFALSLTFADNEDILRVILNYKYFDEIWDCLRIESSTQGEEIYALVDQWNAIGPDNDNNKSNDITKIRRDLQKLSFSFYFISSASSNYFTARSMRRNQKSEIICGCFGGFTKVFSVIFFQIERCCSKFT